MGQERLIEKNRLYLEGIFKQIPNLKEFWWTKEQLRSFYQAKDRAEGEKILERVLIATNAYTEGVHTKIKLLKRASYGLRNIEVYVKKMHLGFLPPFLMYLHHTF